MIAGQASDHTSRMSAPRSGGCASAGSSSACESLKSNLSTLSNKLGVMVEAESTRGPTLGIAGGFRVPEIQGKEEHPGEHEEHEEHDEEPAPVAVPLVRARRFVVVSLEEGLGLPVAQIGLADALFVEAHSLLDRRLGLVLQHGGGWFSAGALVRAGRLVGAFYHMDVLGRGSALRQCPGDAPLFFRGSCARPLDKRKGVRVHARMLEAIGAWLSAFFVTQLVEVPIYVAAQARQKSPARRLSAQIALAFGASAITHPIVWFVIPLLPARHYWEMVVRAEAFAVGVEGLYFYFLRLKRPFVWALVANGASLSLGLLSRYLFDWP